MHHGEYKTVGGKLVIADFSIEDGQLCDVSISGDFFLEPAEALQEINKALNGMPVSATQDELSGAILERLSPDVEMIGFSPEAVAIAVRRGIDES